MIITDVYGIQNAIAFNVLIMPHRAAFCAMCPKGQASLFASAAGKLCYAMKFALLLI